MPDGLDFEPISKEDFERIEDTNIKLNVLYGYVHSTNERILRLAEDHNRRITKLENRSKWDKAVSAIAGFVGGFVAAVLHFLGILRKMQ